MIEHFISWGIGASRGKKGKLRPIYIRHAHLLPIRVLRLLGRIIESEWQDLALVIVLDAKSEEEARRFQGIFNHATMVPVEVDHCSTSKRSLCKSFQIRYLADKFNIDPERAQELAEYEQRYRNLSGEEPVSSLMPPALGSWENIYGYAKVKERLKSLLSIFTASLARLGHFGLVPTKGILLHGPSGCGKSEFAKAIASAWPQLPMVRLRPTDILSKYLGESEARLRRVFAQARALCPAILLIDNIGALGVRRGPSADTTGIGERLLSTLLNELDGVGNKSTTKGGTGSLLVIGCTSNVKILDDALIRPGRLDHHIEIGPPSPDDICCLLEGFLHGLCFAEPTDADTRELCSLFVDATPAQIKSHLQSHASQNVLSPLPLPIGPLIEHLRGGKNEF